MVLCKHNDDLINFVTKGLIIGKNAYPPDKVYEPYQGILTFDTTNINTPWAISIAVSRTTAILLFTNKKQHTI